MASRGEFGGFISGVVASGIVAIGFMFQRICGKFSVNFI